MITQSQIDDAIALSHKISSQGLNTQTILLAMLVQLLTTTDKKDNTNGSTKRRKGEIPPGS